MSAIVTHAWCTDRVLKKGMVFRRRSDGYVFRVTSASRALNGAAMQCVDATMVYGWWTAEQLVLGFDRVMPVAPKKHRHDFRDGDVCSTCDAVRS